jgi:hypothetical protein
LRQHFCAPIQIFGVDFTSAPRAAKPIVAIECELEGEVLTYKQMHEYTDWQGFEAWLNQPGEWIAGMDFPLGLPRRLIEALAWGESWQDYVRLVAGMSRSQFVATLDSYRQKQTAGDKEHRRRADVLAGAISPMKLYVVPVGKMFYEGVKRLWQAGICVPSFDDGGNEKSKNAERSDRIGLETYPALAVRRWIGRSSYKHDRKAKQTEAMRSARAEVMAKLRSPDLAAIYGVRLMITDAAAEVIVADGSGDRLDALICAVQAAWAVGQPGYGIPADCDRLEGWIVDPSMKIS